MPDSALPPLDQQLDEATARFAAMQPKAPARFTFHWRDIPFVAHIDGSGSQMRIAGDLGPVPFTVEAAGTRRRLLHLVGATRGAAVQFVLGGGGRLSVRLETSVSAPLTCLAVVSAATGALLRAVPWIDLAAEAY